MTYNAEAVLGLSNTHGISIMIDPEDSDYLYYKYHEDEPVRAEILYLPAEVEEEETLPMFKTTEGIPFRVDEFIRVDYPNI